jgi:hypothetical protein
MPVASVWLVRTGLLHLLAGFALGTVMLAQKGLVLGGTGFTVLRPLHAEVLTLGWTVNLGMGVAFWILPRVGTGAVRAGAAQVLVAAGLLNAGVLAVGLAPVLGARSWLPVWGRVAELGAALLFGAHAWRRVTTSSSAPR